MASFPISYSSLKFIEDLYGLYQQDPLRVDSSWRYFFEGMEFAHPLTQRLPGEEGSLSGRLAFLVQAYRMYGHLAADIDPICAKVQKSIPELDYTCYGLDVKDLSAACSSFGVLPYSEVIVSDLINTLQSTYSGKIGVEYFGFPHRERQIFIEKYMETELSAKLDSAEQLFIFDYLNKAELFEAFMHTKFVGQKRFSLEGAETLIPMLATLLSKGADLAVEEIVLGMSHRGRLNVLANILNKSCSVIFHEFEDHYSPFIGQGTGDVKYHKGFEAELTTHKGKQIRITLASNPSHLESVAPLVEGRARARQEILEGDVRRVLPIVIHGDASIAGQGVVYETLQLSRLEGYSTGGTIHIVINNQIGFTTTPQETRSTHYCTDIAKAFGYPVLHVNAEDPVSCIRAVSLAIELRQKFSCDVFIDLNGYRKYGHNEGDEPAFTQPLQYQRIRAKESIREIYKQKLVAEGILTSSFADQKEEECKKDLQKALEQVPPFNDAELDVADYYTLVDLIQADVPIKTTKDLTTLAERFCKVPAGFTLHPKIGKLFAERLSILQGDSKLKKVDWATAEYLSFGSLLSDGVSVRLSGQDSQRGTFSQRHAVWVDQNSAEKYFPLQHLGQTQGSFRVLNSPLSEYAVLGFDLGYSLSSGDTLTIWEAQYGDFANAAQVIIDQYLSSLEQKWNLCSNITLLLPHGYEGQGPEHSSARIERYLQLAAQGNLIIANCSTPAQYYHILRRQAFLKKPKPLVVFSPKALLRHPHAVSSVEDLCSGSFQTVLSEGSLAQAFKVLLCSGKVFYDLLEERRIRGLSSIAIVRIEQLYPFPDKEVLEILQQCIVMQKILWVQEEHSNMGAYEYIRPLLQEIVGSKLTLGYAGRPRSASTAAGSYFLHKKQYQKMMEQVFS